MANEIHLHHHAQLQNQHGAIANGDALQIY